MVNDKATFAATSVRSSGILAFVPVSGREATIYVDMIHLETDKAYRIVMNPYIGGTRFEGILHQVRRPDSLVFAGVINRKAALYALPVGRYRPKYTGYVIDSKRMGSFRVDGDTLVLGEDRIVSLGFVGVGLFQEGFLDPLRVVIQPLGPDIDTILQNTADSGLARRRIVRNRLRLDPKGWW